MSNCMVCGSQAEYLCSIHEVGIGLCERHMESATGCDPSPISY